MLPQFYITMATESEDNMNNKNKFLTYWWNLPIDELEEMADENGKIKLERTNMSKEEMKANILKNIEKDNKYFNKQKARIYDKM